ncbi:MAG: methionyl-tRNA formyltransferase [Bacteroidia bacterium]|nr:methionyl-tRNA formyltransferase [Bacteroidia bacterium]
MKIVFYGTPQFAVASLKKLIEHKYNVIAVVTSPDKPAGRGMKLTQSAIKQFAIEKNIPVLQPTNLKSQEFTDELSKLNPDLQIVIAFRMMPEKVWNFPPLGTFNLHASLLPDYRGAAPINRAIMNCENVTGVTTFFLKHEIDTGNIILQEKVQISNEDNAGTLHDKLMNIGADLVIKSLQKIKKGNYTTTPQKAGNNNKIAPKIFTDDCKINWENKLEKISCQVRGLSPYPGAFTIFNDKILKIYKGNFIKGNTENSNEFEITNDRKLIFKAIDGWYFPEIVQPEGRKKMNIQEFLNGLK